MRRGLVFGSFDFLHYGHVRMLRACRDQCDHLTVIVHADTRISRLKGRTPLPLEDRVRDVADLRSVGLVLRGNERTKAEWIENLMPDVVFVGEETARWSWTTPTVVIPRTPGVSSTALRAEASG